MTLNQRHFSEWGYSQNQELATVCHGLPILAREKAAAFFAEAERITEDSREPAETSAEQMFHGLSSTLYASDTQEFDVRWEVEGDGIADGVMVVETHDPVIAVLQCVARIDEDVFLTRTFSFDDLAAVKRLIGAA